jgi:glutamate-1-semialdehyde aminotransferase
VAAGLATLRALEDRTTYDRLEQLGARFERGVREAAKRTGIPWP